MKVLQLISSLGSGGAERLVVDLCNELVEQGADVSLCVMYDDQIVKNSFYRDELDERIQFISLQQSKGFSLKKVRILCQTMKTIQPDVVHAHLGMLIYCFFVAVIFPHKRFFHTIHTIAEKSSTSKIVYYFSRFFYRTNIIQPITISQICYSAYKNLYGASNAVIIKNGRKFVQKSHAFEKVKKEVEAYKRSLSETVFVHVARYHEAKNQVLLIDVFNRLAAEGVAYQLLIIGDWSSLEAQRLMLQANERIHFLGVKSNISDYLMLSDAFCLSSVYEGMPISLIEAFSCGCVPICTAVGGIKDMIEDGVSGYLALEVIEEEYYKAIKRFLGNTEFVSKVSLITLFKDNYSIVQCAAKHMTLYTNY